MLLFFSFCSENPVKKQDYSGGLKQPPLGWNSWNAFGWDISEVLMKASLNVFDTTLAAYGYEYFVLDDGWQISTYNGEHIDSFGRCIPDVYKFPSGMNILSVDQWVCRHTTTQSLNY